MSEINAVQLALTQTLDAHCPIDVRREQEARLERLEHAARLAVRECRQAKLDQAKALNILLRLWREP